MFKNAFRTSDDKFILNAYFQICYLTFAVRNFIEIHGSTINLRDLSELKKKPLKCHFRLINIYNALNL